MTARPLPVALPPRLGFAGTGWIGRHRLQAIAGSGAARIAAVAEPSPDATAPLRETFGDAVYVADLDALLELDLDGIVIATPSALHAEQSIRALDAGCAVFCQKPLGRTRREAEDVIAAARRAGRLLGVDLSYRFAAAFAAVNERIAAGEVGEVFSARLVFHNAYGPDKEWFYDRARSGGGCLIDLGTHLVDFALDSLGWPEVSGVRGALFAGGRRLAPPLETVEDYASGTITLASGAEIALACSWRLPAGCDAVIEASFYGTKGGLTVRNVGGSFYDFVAERFDGTATTRIVDPPDAWGGRAAVAWAMRLASDPAFDPAIERVAEVAGVLDRLYGGGR